MAAGARSDAEALVAQIEPYVTEVRSGRTLGLLRAIDLPSLRDVLAAV